ncbi:MAG: sterol desaturase family protein, partial [Bacteroidetes bacterium]|nr:sterol desaturase family protein [Bacteroidota bacterium]
MTPELISASVVSLAAFVIIILERIFPYRKNQKIFRKGFFNDFFLYTILQNYVLGLVIFSFLIYVYGNTRINNLRLLAGIPVYIQVLGFIITHDFYIYWFHRWQHNNAVLWRIHEAHHSPEDVDWLSGSKSHALEILINQTVEFAPLIFLGASPDTVLAKGVISAVWGMFIHSNIDVRMGYLQYFING